jgi:hypothetical protein
VHPAHLGTGLQVPPEVLPPGTGSHHSRQVGEGAGVGHMTGTPAPPASPLLHWLPPSPQFPAPQRRRSVRFLCAGGARVCR